jgi:hypothetical protein
MVLLGLPRRRMRIRETRQERKNWKSSLIIGAHGRFSISAYAIFAGQHSPARGRGHGYRNRASISLNQVTSYEVTKDILRHRDIPGYSGFARLKGETQ